MSKIDNNKKRKIEVENSANEQKNKKVKIDKKEEEQSMDFVKNAKLLVQQLSKQFQVNGTTLRDKVTSEVAKQWNENKSQQKRGKVLCGCVWRGISSDQMPYQEGFIPIFVSKGKGQIGNALSPFNLFVPQPMLSNFTVDGKQGSSLLPNRPLELVWQSAKITPDEIDKNGKVKSSFFERRKKIFKEGKVKRRYLDKSQTIAGALFGGEGQTVVQWVPSRIFYCTSYDTSVQKKKEFKLLENLVENGFNILLLGPDGFPIGPNEEDIKLAYESTAHPFGHERVLLALLRGIKPWTSYPHCWE
eukprot:c19484_g1_i1.p1 GENE.c19484_g1_i1~~c19484_g1_i1.p1  ORF type:complete len:302 (+),score=108.98 c19484_g1_i1:143-1048(+)